MVVAMPLIFRWVPPNRAYGFRIPATLKNESVWYDANALIGRHLFVLGAVLSLLAFYLPPARPSMCVCSPRIGVVGLFGILMLDWRTANRWRREREQNLR